mgnify:CR=1 FL=1
MYHQTGPYVSQQVSSIVERDVRQSHEHGKRHESFKKRGAKTTRWKRVSCHNLSTLLGWSTFSLDRVSATTKEHLSKKKMDSLFFKPTNVSHVKHFFSNR